MDNDMKITDKVDTGVNGILTFAGGSDMNDTEFSQAVDAFRFGGVGDDFFFVVAFLFNFIGDFLIAESLFINFIEYPDGFGRKIDKTAEKGGRVVGITEIQPESGRDIW